MKKLILIDGNAIVHRAFHALPPLTNKDGVMTNAVYGFFSMFLKIIQDIVPEYVVVCFDRPKPTFRQELFVGYQQHRPKMSDDLVPQIGFIHEVLEAMKVKIFEVDGYEADDLIGTLAAQATEINTNTTNKYQYQISNKNRPKEKKDLKLDIGNLEFEIIIVSGDRDLLQLVNSHVKMIAPVTGITNMIDYTAEKVEEKFGIKPSQIVDYKALIGDASDGYPGVNGIGPKTAASLLQKYKSLEGLYHHIAELPGKISQKLATDAEQAALAKKLATIVTDAPITFDLEECSMEHFDADAGKKMFEKLGIKSLQNRLPKPVKKAKESEENSNQLGLLD